MLGRENKREFKSEENIKLLSLLCLNPYGEKRKFSLIFLDVEKKKRRQ